MERDLISAEATDIILDIAHRLGKNYEGDFLAFYVSEDENVVVPLTR